MKCPNCGSKRISTTLVGCIGLDTNEARCSDCKAVGVAYEWNTMVENATDLLDVASRGWNDLQWVYRTLTRLNAIRAKISENP